MSGSCYFMPSSLYICYFGLGQPLVQTQVIPYLLELAKDGIKVSLITFEEDLEEGAAANALRTEMSSKGIDWHWLHYHKRPSALATAYDVFRGAWFVRRFISKRKPDVLHGRVHIPMLMAVLARRLSGRKPKLLFDIRGFFPEEYTDAGIWPENGPLYRLVKMVERWLMKEADGFVVLTEKAREMLFPESVDGGLDKFGRPVEVIPCCVDLKKRFPPLDTGGPEADLSDLRLDKRFVITHVGALGGLYLTEEIVDLLAASRSRRPDTFALFLTQTDPSIIIPLLEQAGFSDRDYFVRKVDPANVSDYLRLSHAALSFVKASFSTQSRSPTKNAEYLACGLPIIANDGVGDTTEQITTDETGVIIREFNTVAYNNVLDCLDELLSDREALARRCRASAERRFDLERVGGERYRKLYRKLLQNV